MTKRRWIHGVRLSPYFERLPHKRLFMFIDDIEREGLSKELRKQYGIHKSISDKDIFKFLPPKMSKQPCPNCGGRLFYKITNKKETVRKCEGCKHKEGDVPCCSCESCLKSEQLSQTSYIPQVQARSLQMSFCPYSGCCLHKGTDQEEKLKAFLYSGEISCRFKLTLRQGRADLICLDSSGKVELCRFVFNCDFMEEWLERQRYRARFHFHPSGELHLSSCSKERRNIEFRFGL